MRVSLAVGESFSGWLQNSLPTTLGAAGSGRMMPFDCFKVLHRNMVDLGTERKFRA